MAAKKNTHPVSEDMDENERYFYHHTNHLSEDQQCFDMEDRVAFLYILARRSENPRVTNKEILSLSMNASVKAYMLRDHMVDHSVLACLKKKYVQKILSICPEYSTEQAASAPRKDKKKVKIRFSSSSDAFFVRVDGGKEEYMTRGTVIDKGLVDSENELWQRAANNPRSDVPRGGWERFGVSPSSEGCFVATACYGTTDCCQVADLRRFRDKNLLPVVWGRALVSMYYAVSPPIAKWLKARPRWALFVRERLLDGFADRVRRRG